MTEKERMLAGKLYKANDPELISMVKRKNKILLEFNKPEASSEERVETLKKLLGAIGKNSYIHEPFYCDYGENIYIGEHFYANYDCVFLDVNKITIGNNVFMAPRVCLFTAGHPIDKDIRAEELEYGYPITIGDDVWIGGNVVINPGVTIGSNVVIGSGSVVTKDIPSNVIAAGNPCRVIREITKKDHDYWQLQKDEYLNN